MLVNLKNHITVKIGGLHPEILNLPQLFTIRPGRYMRITVRMPAGTIYQIYSIVRARIYLGACPFSSFDIIRNSRITNTTANRIATQSAIGPANTIPSKPILLGRISNKGIKKSPCLVNVINNPLYAFPIDVKKPAESGCNPYRHNIII